MAFGSGGLAVEAKATDADLGLADHTTYSSGALAEQPEPVSAAAVTKGYGATLLEDDQDALCAAWEAQNAPFAAGPGGCAAAEAVRQHPGPWGRR